MRAELPDLQPGTDAPRNSSREGFTVPVRILKAPQ